MNKNREISNYTNIPKRFESCRFETYKPNNKFLSQLTNKRILETILFKLNSYSKSNRISKYFIRKKNTIRGIYIEGKYGVGKTHLLASAFSAFEGKKAFVSFSDLIALIHYYSFQTIKTYFKNIELVCIDEFELDDPGNTMIISNFLSYLIECDSFIITTSNTIPEELGSGRFNIKDFKNEIGQINSYFRVLQIDGEDYRKKDHDINYELKSNSFPSDYTKMDFNVLNETLKNKSLMEIIDFAETSEKLFVNNIIAFEHQDKALRFSFFIDKIYDRNKNFKIHFNQKSLIFNEALLEGTFEKKYKRCISRLYEITQNLS